MDPEDGETGPAQGADTIDATQANDEGTSAESAPEDGASGNVDAPLSAGTDGTPPGDTIDGAGAAPVTAHGAPPADAPGAGEHSDATLIAEVAVDDAPEVSATSSLIPVAGGASLLALVGLAAFFLTRGAPRPVSAPTPPPAAPRGEASGADVPEAAVVATPPSTIGRLRDALARTRATFGGGLAKLFGESFDDDALEDLEMLLLSSDVGMPTTERLLGVVRERAKEEGVEGDVLKAALFEEMGKILSDVQAPLASKPADGPLVILVVGVNGSGKTTTIGKIAHRYTKQGLRVLLAAGDTYRAAAAEQLTVWAERSGAEIVTHQAGADPGAVVYDALSAATARGHDVVIIDTAGRLQTAKPLMDQLSKVRRVIGKLSPDGPHETLLVVDGTMGQNALSQATLFDQATPLTGVVVTKLDGTAKGGMILTIAAELSLAVKLVGVGEQVEDLRDFDAKAFVEAIA